MIEVLRPRGKQVTEKHLTRIRSEKDKTLSRLRLLGEDTKENLFLSRNPARVRPAIFEKKQTALRGGVRLSLLLLIMKALRGPEPQRFLSGGPDPLRFLNRNVSL